MRDIPEWARKRAYERAEQYGHVGVPCGAIDAFAAYIAAHEEPPVDPLLVEARHIVSCNSSGRYSPSEERRIEAGECDNTEPVQVALAALKRGMKLAREAKS